MKTQRIIGALAVGATLLLAACGGSESAVRTKNAALGKPAVVATGSCDDGEMIEGVDDDDCVIDMKIGKATRKFNLQLLNTDGDWDTIDSAVAKRGVLKLDVPATDEDGYWLDGQYTFRLFAARSGKNPEYISDDLDILYGTEMSADDTAEMTDDEEVADSGASPELKSAIQDIQQPTTRFDDFCTKLFDRIDCALMFRPGRGPDFTTLGKNKWVKMCSTLLKRPEGDCEMEFKFATEMQKPTGMQPGMGGMQSGMQPGSGGNVMPQGSGLDPVKLAAACAAIGMTEADCRAAIQAGPMAALQKFGDKAETFCKAYGGKSCTELLAGALTTGGMQPGSGMQPGMGGTQPGMQQGSGMQPGMQPGMQSGTQPGSGMRPGMQPGTQPGSGMQPGMGGNTMQTPTTVKG